MRHALQDDAHHAAYVETVAKRGYQLVAPVQSLDTDHSRQASALDEDRAARAQVVDGGKRSREQAAMAAEAHRAGTALHELLGRLLGTGLSEHQVDVLKDLAARCEELLAVVDGLARASELHK